MQCARAIYVMVADLFRLECLHYMFLTVANLIVEVGGVTPSKSRVSVRLRSA